MIYVVIRRSVYQKIVAGLKTLTGGKVLIQIDGANLITKHQQWTPLRELLKIKRKKLQCSINRMDDR
jgi:hypothetical protein